MKLENKKIIIVTNRTNSGGVAKISNFLANFCVKYFDEVYILALYDNIKSEKLDDDVKFIHIETPYSNNHLSKFEYNINLIKQIRNVIKDVKPDIACTLGSDVSTRFTFASTGYKIPIVSSERGDPRELSYIWRLLTSYAYKRANYLVFQTPLIQQMYQGKIKNSTVIANPCFILDDEEKVMSERKKNIVSAGRLSPEKNFNLLIEAFSIVLKEHPEYKLIIYGEGPLRDVLESKVQNLGLQRSVELPGQVNNLNSYIYDASVFVLSSKYEGMPNTLIEAMALGVPTVATDCGSGGPAFLTDNGRRGILVSVNDIQAISNGIKKILNDDKISEKLSVNALEIRNELSPSIIEKKWIDVFSSITQ